MSCQYSLEPAFWPHRCSALQRGLYWGWQKGRAANTANVPGTAAEVQPQWVQGGSGKDKWDSFSPVPYCMLTWVTVDSTEQLGGVAGDYLLLLGCPFSQHMNNQSKHYSWGEQENRKKSSSKTGRNDTASSLLLLLSSNSVIDVATGKAMTDWSHVLDWADQPHSAAGHCAMCNESVIVTALWIKLAF